MDGSGRLKTQANNGSNLQMFPEKERADEDWSGRQVGKPHGELGSRYLNLSEGECPKLKAVQCEELTAFLGI